jgi:hypothetical protein
MSKRTFASVWDALEDSPGEAANLRARADDRIVGHRADDRIVGHFVAEMSVRGGAINIVSPGDSLIGGLEGKATLQLQLAETDRSPRQRVCGQISGTIARCALLFAQRFIDRSAGCSTSPQVSRDL